MRHRRTTVAPCYNYRFSEVVIDINNQYYHNKGERWAYAERKTGSLILDA